MRKSEIFDSFVKIAQEKGMISNDSSEAKKKIEQTGRASSSDITAIEALYGVKPDVPKDMDYKSNIMEIAHPNSVVVSPSYDKLNGLVESNIERQNILLNIVNKPVNGHITQHKYAKKELILSLVRIGNDLDNKNKEELCALADYCLSQTTEPMKKNAGVWGIAGIAAIVGGLWLQQHMRMVSEGFDKDHEKLIAEIDDVLNSNTDWGFGTQYKQEFHTIMQEFKSKLESFYRLYKQIIPIVEDLEKPRDAKELEERASKSDVINIQKAIDAFRKAVLFIEPECKQMINNFKNEQYKQRQTENKGWITSLVDKTQIFHGSKGLVADDLDDISRALQTYLLDIQNIGRTLAGVTSIQQDVTKRLQEARMEADKIVPESKPTSISEKKDNPIQSIDEEASKLTDMLNPEKVFG